MQAPKCRVCGKVEWKHVCRGSPPKQSALVIQPRPKPIVPGAAVRLGTAKRDRKEYMRKFMKKKRAKVGATA